MPAKRPVSPMSASFSAAPSTPVRPQSKSVSPYKRGESSRRQSIQSGTMLTPRKISSHNANTSFEQRIESAFNAFSIDEGGSHKGLLISSVQNALFAIALNPASSRITKVLARDGYSQRALLLSDFARLALTFSETAANLRNTIKHFKVLDTDQDDKISRQDFAAFVASQPHGDRIVGKSLTEVMDSLDPSESGTIHMKAFLHHLFLDEFTEEEIMDAMIANGFDPACEAKEKAALAARKAADAAVAAEKHRVLIADRLSGLIKEERVLRAELSAQEKRESADCVEPAFAQLVTAVTASRSAAAKVKSQQDAVDTAKTLGALTITIADIVETWGPGGSEERRTQAESAARNEEAKRLADEAAKRSEEEKRKKEEEEQRKREEEEKKKEEEEKRKAEAEKQRKVLIEKQEQERKQNQNVPPPPPVVAEVKRDSDKKDGGGCCLVM